MLKKIIIVTAIITSAIDCIAQKPSEFNWQSLDKSINAAKVALPVKIGEFTVFKINDINKFLFKVEIAGNVFELQTPIPTELQTLFKLTPLQLAQRENENKVQEGAAAVDKEATKMKEVKKKVTASQLKLENPEQEELLNKMNELIASCDTYYAKTTEIANEVFKLKAFRNKLIVIAQLDRSYAVINGMVEDLGLPDIVDIKYKYTSLKAIYAKVEDSYSQAKLQAEKLVETIEENSVNDTTENAKKNLKQAKFNLSKIEEASKGIEKAEDLIEEEALLALVDEIDFLYNELRNKNNFIVVSPPVQMDGDFVSYTVKITPSITKTLGPNRSPMQFKFDIPAKKGLKVDFGVGPAISFGNNAKDDKYFLATIDANGRLLGQDSVRLTKLKNNNAISPSIAAMMHIYARSGKLTSWGGSFGVGAGFQNTNDINLSLYTGLCVVFGKREKIMLSGGVSWLKIERRKEDRYLATGDRFKASDINLSEATEKVFKPSLFLGITYSLTNKIEIK